MVVSYNVCDPTHQMERFPSPTGLISCIHLVKSSQKTCGKPRLIQKPDLEGDWRNFLSITLDQSDIFYCQLAQVATARGLVLSNPTLALL